VHVNPQKGINKMHWRKAQVKFGASTIVETRHVVLKPSPGLGRLRVVGLASQGYTIEENKRIS
jgi:hypothetical protein